MAAVISRAPVLGLVGVLCVLHARADEKPLWEAGLGIGALSFPDYRGSDQTRLYPVPVPYFVYRGDFLKADRNGLRGEFLNREYVEEDQSKRLCPTSLGRVVADLLVAAFPDILEVGFTASLEQELDGVEEGRENWVKTLKRFYGPFQKRLGEAKKKMPGVKQGIPTDLKCEQDGGTMMIRWGRNGEFLACSNYPKCTNTSEFVRDEQGKIIPKEPSTPLFVLSR